jgi:hypothetical protein
MLREPMIRAVIADALSALALAQGQFGTAAEASHAREGSCSGEGRQGQSA